MKSEIGECVYILFYKRWGKTLVDGQLKSKSWWENRVKTLIEAPAIKIPKEYLKDVYPIQPTPIPFEIEINMPDLDIETLLKAWKQM